MIPLDWTKRDTPSSKGFYRKDSSMKKHLKEREAFLGVTKNRYLFYQPVIA